MINENEIDAIREEAERLYPVEDAADFTKNKQMDNAFAVVMQDAYVAGVTKERERAKDFCNEVKRFMETIPIDNGNVFFNGFDEYRLKIIQLINDYTNEPPTPDLSAGR